jgi:hypothetical protein
MTAKHDQPAKLFSYEAILQDLGENLIKPSERPSSTSLCNVFMGRSLGGGGATRNLKTSRPFGVLSKHKFFIDLHKGVGEIKNQILGGSRARPFVESRLVYIGDQVKLLDRGFNNNGEFLWIWSCTYQLCL